MLQSDQINVGTSPVQLTVPDVGVSAIILQPVADIYVGARDVTAATGYKVPAGASLALDLTGERLYAVTASGTSKVYVLRTGITRVTTY